VALAERIRAVKADSRVEGLRWEDGCLVADVALSLLRGDGEPLTLVERDGRWWLDPELLDGVPATEDGWEVTDPFRLAYAELVVKDRDREDWWYPEGDLKLRLEPLGEGRSRLVAEGRLRLDPARLAGGRPLERGVHDVWAYVQLLGIDRMVRVTGDGTPGRPAGPGPVLAGGRVALPYWTGSGQLALDMDQRQRRLGDDIAQAAAANGARGRRSLPLPLPAQGAGAAPVAVKVRLGEGKQAPTVDAELVPGPGGSAELRLPERVKAADGRHTVSLANSKAPVGHAVVQGGKLLRLEGPAYEAGAARRLLDAADARLRGRGQRG
jgi:hypothetical protein